jgi:hypothetical protein
MKLGARGPRRPQGSQLVHVLTTVALLASVAGGERGSVLCGPVRLQGRPLSRGGALALRGGGGDDNGELICVGLVAHQQRLPVLMDALAEGARRERMPLEILPLDPLDPGGARPPRAVLSRGPVPAHACCTLTPSSVADAADWTEPLDAWICDPLSCAPRRANARPDGARAARAAARPARAHAARPNPAQGEGRRGDLCTRSDWDASPRAPPQPPSPPVLTGHVLSLLPY